MKKKIPHKPLKDFSSLSREEKLDQGAGCSMIPGNSWKS